MADVVAGCEAAWRFFGRLLGLVRRYTAAAVEQACARALEIEVIDIPRVARMVEQAIEQTPLPARPQPGEAAPGRSVALGERRSPPTGRYGADPDGAPLSCARLAATGGRPPMDAWGGQ